MPVYAYECKECGVRFDRRQSFSDEPIRICPECEGSVHRLIQPAGVIFKGSGFYVTDNRGSKTASGGATNKGETKAESSSSSESKSEAKAESKPAKSAD